MPVYLPTKTIAKFCNPFVVHPWHCQCRLTRRAIKTALHENRLQKTPYLESDDTDEEWHVERIAYLVQYGWKDAISLDVGVPSLRCHVDWMIQDGNHRFAAAMYRKDEFILCTVDGCIDYAFEVFGIDVTEGKLCVR